MRKIRDRDYILDSDGNNNIEKYLNEDGVVRLGQMINRVLINPEYQSKSIVSNLNELDKYYPLTKKRRFAMQIRINGDDYALNPIFQSLLMPAYICKIAGTKLPCYFQASSSGHSMLKWHFLRIILNDILFGEVPYSHLFLHGNILGLNGKPMSKHAGNAVQPSELFRELKDKRFVRYMLIKSISFKDVLIQIDLSKNEYLKIKTKLDQLENGLRVKSTEKIVSLIEGGFKELERMNFKLALENLYLVCRKAELVDGLEGNEELTKKFMALKNILLN
ncbi:MAG: isoleucyl-tRNA synthetase [Microgenomates group bacterium ADurb.Bin238]|nr:MAG: isoleucyl-tRNA synthetase [Microgenomates group bacterium ADurb.Bin238]